MREVVYLTQDEIDTIVQGFDENHRDDNNWRALQDSLISEFTTAFKIYRRDDRYEK